MTVYAPISIDRPDSVALRMAPREAHLAYVRERQSQVKFAAPFVSDAGEMNGTILQIEAESRAEAESFQAEPPYAKAGLFGRVDIRICPPNYEFIRL